MYGMSSALASQTANKITAWNCLVMQGLVPHELTKFDADRMTVEAWAVGIRVVLKRGYKGLEVFNGLSTIISPLKIATQMFLEAERKSRDLTIQRIRENVFLVDSFQKAEKHTVMAYSDKLTCSCMKFKCLSARLPREAADLLQAMGQVTVSDIDGSEHLVAFAKGKTHIQCHHIRAVMKQGFRAITLEDYLINRKFCVMKIAS